MDWFLSAAVPPQGTPPTLIPPPNPPVNLLCTLRSPMLLGAEVFLQLEHSLPPLLEAVRCSLISRFLQMPLSWYLPCHAILRSTLPMLPHLLLVYSKHSLCEALYILFGVFLPCLHQNVKNTRTEIFLLNMLRVVHLVANIKKK